MTQEEKAKAYDRALKVLHKYDGANIMFSQSLKEEMFPELKESEDEKIRKAILEHIQLCTESIPDRDKFIAWLEKQGEQETDEWKEGNIIRHGGILALVVKGRRAMKSNGELFTVQYPKEWVKAVPNEIECFLNELEKQGEQKPVNRLKITAGNWYVCEMEVMNENMVTAFHRDEIYYCPKDGYLDVRGALFEVGCLDVFRLATEKEIPQPKQEWKQENTGDLTDFENAMMHIGGSFFGDNAGLDPNDTNTIKEQANLLLGLVPSKEWSEEDEEYCQFLIKNIENSDPLPTSIYSDCKDWLKSLKDRVQPQPKQEWDEDTQQWIDTIIFDYKSWYDADKDHRTTIQAKINILKSLKERYTWKPSDEQIRELSIVSTGKGWFSKEILRELLEQLKKLREE